MAETSNRRQLFAESNKLQCPSVNGTGGNEFIKLSRNKVLSRTSENNLGFWKAFHDLCPITNAIEYVETFDGNLKAEVKVEYADDALPASTIVNSVKLKSNASLNEEPGNGRSFTVKQEEDDNWESNTPPLSSAADKLILWNFKEKIPACYYSGSFLVTCPACDKSFKEGKRRLQSILKHVDMYHCTKRISLKRAVRAHFRTRKPCDCFACTSLRL